MVHWFITFFCQTNCACYPVNHTRVSGRVLHGTAAVFIENLAWMWTCTIPGYALVQKYWDSWYIVTVVASGGHWTDYSTWVCASGLYLGLVKQAKMSPWNFLAIYSDFIRFFEHICSIRVQIRPFWAPRGQIRVQMGTNHPGTDRDLANGPRGGYAGVLPDCHRRRGNSRLVCKFIRH